MQDTFITTDVNLAAVILTTNKTQLIAVRKGKKKSVEFVFPKKCKRTFKNVDD